MGSGDLEEVLLKGGHEHGEILAWAVSGRK